MANKPDIGIGIEFYNRKRPRNRGNSSLLAEKRQNPTRSAGAKSSVIYTEICPNIGE